MYETVVPPLDERDFEKTVTPIVQEYFEHGDTNEVAVSVIKIIWKAKKKKRNNTTIKPKTSKCAFPFPGAACRAELGAYAEGGALTGCVAGPGGQSQPPRAHLQAAGRPLWACFVAQRYGKVIRQTPQRIARFSPGHTRGRSGEC